MLLLKSLCSYDRKSRWTNTSPTTWLLKISTKHLIWCMKGVVFAASWRCKHKMIHAVLPPIRIHNPWNHLLLWKINFYRLSVSMVGDGFPEFSVCITSRIMCYSIYLRLYLVTTGSVRMMFLEGFCFGWSAFKHKFDLSFF